MLGLKRLPLPLSLESSKRLGGSDDLRDSFPWRLRGVYRCPGGRRCSVCGLRCRGAPGPRRALILPETVSARRVNPRSPCLDTVQGESWTPPTTPSAVRLVQRSSESSSQSILRLKGTRVSLRERSGSSATNDQETI